MADRDGAQGSIARERIYLSGRLLFCATPIGNLGDISVRALETLRSAHAVYAEDTRRTRILLEHYGIQCPLRSCHAHNERERATEIVQRVLAGETVVYMTDAGTPCVSDPGRILLAVALEAGVEPSVLPGPSAVIAAVSLAPLDGEGRFAFYGFPPRRPAARREHFTAALAQAIQGIWYESPHRLSETLADICAIGWEHRRAAVARELTKIHEEVVRGTVAELRAYFTTHPARGEVVLTVEGAARETADEDPLEKAVQEVRQRCLAGEPTSRAVIAVAAASGVSRNRLYRAVVVERRE